MEMLEDLRKNHAIKLAEGKISHDPLDKVEAWRQRFPSFDRFLVRIDCGNLIPGRCQRDCKLRPVATADVEDAQFAAFSFRKLPQHRIIHKAKALAVPP